MGAPCSCFASVTGALRPEEAELSPPLSTPPLEPDRSSGGRAALLSFAGVPRTGCVVERVGVVGCMSTAAAARAAVRAKLLLASISRRCVSPLAPVN